MMIATMDRRPRSRSRSLPPLPLRRALVLTAVVGGALLQHALVGLPLEQAPAPLRPAALRAPGGPPAPCPQGGGGSPGAAPARPVGGATTARRTAPSTEAVKGTRVGASVTAAVPPAPAGAVPAAAPSVPADAALSASIWRAFNAYALPYQADSALIVEVGRQFGIDPAIPAALFMHEDGNINNRAAFPDHYNWLLYHTHNPGNIKCMYDPCYNGFQVYPTYRAGILDWFRLYDHYYYDLGIHDLGLFVATYCPPNVDGNGPPTLYQSDVMVKARRIRAGW